MVDACVAAATIGGTGIETNGVPVTGYTAGSAAATLLDAANAQRQANRPPQYNSVLEARSTALIEEQELSGKR